MASVLGSIVIMGYSIGLYWGAVGAAIGLSASLVVWVIPHIAWAIHRTPVTVSDILKSAGRPLFASLISAAVASFPVHVYLELVNSWVRLVVGVSVFLLCYALVFFIGMRQWTLVADVFSTIRSNALFRKDDRQYYEHP